MTTDPSAAQQWTYRRVLTTGRTGVFLTGDLISNIGDGMLLTALPLLTLRIHGSTAPALAIALVQSSPYVLSAGFAFTIGLGRLRPAPRTLLRYDCLLRGPLYTGLGVLALTGRLSLPVLISCLLLGSVLHTAAAGSRRLIATAQVDPAGRLAVNGLLGTSSSLALYAVGPMLGGVLSAVGNPGVALLFDGCSFFVLLAAVRVTIGPRRGAGRGSAADPDQDPGRDPGQAEETVAGSTVPVSGWRVLRRVPAAARLLVVVFCFNLFYMPVEIALPLLVQGKLHQDGTALGAIWAAFGIGALIGAVCTNLLRKLPRTQVLVTIVAGWGLVVLLLAVGRTVPFAVVDFFVGGLIYAPFSPVVYTFVQSVLQPDEQQSVVTLWSAGTLLAAPIGLLLGGPLVTGLGATGALVASAALTLALVPLAATGLRRRAATPGRGDDNGDEKRSRKTEVGR